MASIPSYPAGNHRRHGVAARLFIVVTSVILTMSPSPALLLQAEEPSPIVEDLSAIVEEATEAVLAEEPAVIVEEAPSGTVQGVVWSDVDGDGVRQSDEEGLGGVELVLFDEADHQIDSTVSSGEGVYAFDAVAEGSYRVRVALPEGYDMPSGLDFSLTNLGDQAETEPFDVAAGLEHVLALGLSPTPEDSDPAATATTTIAEETTTDAVEDTTTATGPPSDEEASAAVEVQEITLQPLAAGPPVYEIEGAWVDPPATISRGNPVVAEWRVNVNDSGEPPSNDPVDNVVVDFNVGNAFFDEIPDLCLTVDVDPASSISPDGMVLTCNLGTINMGTAVVVQTPVVANGVTGDEVTHDGTIDGQTVDLPPIPILNPFIMDIHYGINTNARDWDDETDPSFVDADIQWSLRLGNGSDPGPDTLSYVLMVTDSNGNNVNVGVNPRTSVPGCGRFDLGLADGHPWSRIDIPPDHLQNTSFVDTCTLTERPNQPGVFDLVMSGINYDLLNVPPNDSRDGILPPNWDYVASGSLWFRVFTDEAGSISLQSNAPTYTAPTGQQYTDLPGNNSTSKTYTLPGGWSAAWQRVYTFSGGTSWDDTYRVSAGTTVRQVITNRFSGDGAPPASVYGNCLALDTRYVTFSEGNPERMSIEDPVFVWGGNLAEGGAQIPFDDFEYYVGNNPLLDPASPQYDPDQFNCGVDAGGWVDTEPADLSTVRAVRISYPFDFFSQEDVEWIQLYAHTTVNDDVPTGQDVWMFGGHQRQGVWNGPGLGNRVTDTPNARYPFTTGRRDIVRIVTAVPYIEKAAAASTVTPGVPADFTLTYSATGIGIIPPTVDDYVIEDTLPVGMTYLPGSAIPEPVVTMNGGQQVLTWTLDGVETNVEHDLVYQAVADDTVAPGTQLTNVAVSSLDGTSAEPVEETVTTTSNGYTIILKTADVDFIPNDLGDGVGTGSWTVQIDSFDPLPQAFTDTIDILPHVGDQRGTSFSGTYSLDDVPLPDGGTVWYTDADPASLSDDPADPSNGAAGNPAGNTVGWTTTAPENPTAIRVIGGELLPGGTFAFQVVITTNGASMGDVYVNRAQARAEHTELVMRTSAALVVTDYVVVKTSDPVSGSTVLPGDTVNYTITVTQQGPVPAGALLTDDWSDVLDDAIYNNDLATDLGTVSLVDGVVSWNGVIPVGGVATITYSMTLKDVEGLEAEGNTFLNNVVSSPGCLSPEDCETVIFTSWYEYSKTSVVEPGATVLVGEMITYTVEITQVGEGPIEDAIIEDELSAVLDDAIWNDDVSVPVGAASLDGTTLTWTGDLAVGDVVTLTYSVTVTDEGDGQLENVVTSPDEERSRCVPAPDQNPDCMTNHELGSYEVVKTSDPSTTSQVEIGDVVDYTVTIRHVGIAPVEASFEDDASGVLDDALWNHDVQASAGEVSYNQPTLNWTGDLNPGDEVTVTYSVTVTANSDRRLVNVVNTQGVCLPVDGQDQACVTDHAMVLSAVTLPFTGIDIGALLMGAFALVIAGAFIRRAGRETWLDETF